MLFRSIACLRLAEQENCIAGHTIDSCLIPIRAGSLGVHHSTRGSRMAIDEYTAILQNDPEDLTAERTKELRALAEEAFKESR